MGLRDAIPGLKAHDTVVQVVDPVVVSFDNQAAINIIREAVLEVANGYPCGSPWEWLTQNRPDIITELRKSKGAMISAYQSEDQDGVKSAADFFVRSHKKAWKIFGERPPLIERQAALFSEVA